MKKLKFIGEFLLPITLSFIPFGIAIDLVSRGEEPTAIIVGLLTPSILGLFILIRQRKNDYDRKEAIQRRYKNKRRKK
tara:strand:+ start:414 stop:647 length:234 start_codon:yes stop_codon:yes gene_type:complete